MEGERGFASSRVVHDGILPSFYFLQIWAIRLLYRSSQPHLVQESLPFLIRYFVLSSEQNKAAWKISLELGGTKLERDRKVLSSFKTEFLKHANFNFVLRMLKCNMCFLWWMALNLNVKCSGFVLETKLSESWEGLKWPSWLKMFLTPLRLIPHRCEHVLGRMQFYSFRLYFKYYFPE